jgi:signal-transduction protein with cAMP-binding, CBS, and nucleotidyltransferase domain
LYILERGVVELYSHKKRKLYKKVKAINYFGLDVLMTKTARHWCSAITRFYADCLLVDREKFDDLLEDCPKEANYLRTIGINAMEEFNVLSDERLFSLISQHSSKSVGHNYEKEYTRSNIFIRPD